MEPIPLLNKLYVEFNDRNLEFLMNHLADDADWPKGMSGERAVGHEAIRDYWTIQWAQINSQVYPISDRTMGDEVVSEVHQVIRDLDGNVLSDSVVFHCYAFRNGKITKMDVTTELPRFADSAKVVTA